MAYSLKAGTELRYMPNPEKWLEERMYETNWLERAKEVGKETTTEPKPKPFIGTALRDAIDYAREERHRKQAEEEAQNGN